MKTKFLFVAALTMLMCASCQKENSECGVQSGLDTYAGITIILPKEFVESGGSAGETTEESAINSVKVGTWRDGGNAITYTMLDAADFSHDGNGNYIAHKAIEVKTGKTNFFIIANSEEELTIAQISRGEILTKNVADIATSNHFVMYSAEVNTLSNVQLASQEAVKNAIKNSPLYTSNVMSVSLRRAAAKISVTSSFSNNGDDIDDGTVKGRFHDIKWNIANHNSQMTAIANKIDPSGDFVAKNVQSPFAVIANENPMIDVPMSGAAASSAYCLENSHPFDVYTTGNTTAIHVMAVFVPKDRSFYTQNKNVAPGIEEGLMLGTDFIKGSSFFVLRGDIIGSDDSFYYSAGTIFDSSGANYIIRKFSGMSIRRDFTEYSNGVCHWPVYIYDGVNVDYDRRSYGVLRNHSYEVKLTDINSLGVPKFPGDDTPIFGNAYINFRFSVEEWNYYSFGTDYM